MKVHVVALALSVTGACTSVAVGQPENFDTSLHATRAGKPHWYSAANGGFEQITNIPISELGCVGCHGPADANGDPYGEDYTPGCADCHQTNGDWSVTQSQCLSCHGRQKTEQNLGLPDVHRDMGFVCWDCHGTGDLHGDGTEYVSMLQDGAIDADCTNCHDDLPGEHAQYDPHGGALHCSACHASSVLSCYNCHFESQVEAHVKRAKQPLTGFVMLANRTKDGKVATASFQSATYEGQSFAAFGPYAPHTIVAEGRTCEQCHNEDGSNEAITQYNEWGEIRFTEWDDDTQELTWMRGVIPIPEDWQDTLRMDFITYTGNPDDPPPGTADWEYICKDTWDLPQMLYATPLTPDQMAALGFLATERCPADVDPNRMVDFNDLVSVLSDWGGCNVDINDDGVVDFDDLVIVLSGWGPCP